MHAALSESTDDCVDLLQLHSVHVTPANATPARAKSQSTSMMADIDDGIFDLAAPSAESADLSTVAPIKLEAQAFINRQPTEGLEKFQNEERKQASTILLFWKEHDKLYPNLARWARYVFSIPATTAAVERMWHRAKLLVPPLRHCSSAQLVRDELFIAVNEKQVE